MEQICLKCPRILILAKACPTIDYFNSPLWSMSRETLYILCSLFADALIFILFALLFTRRRSPLLLLLFMVCFAAHVTALAIKHFVRGQRPFKACSKSFGMPSNHATVSGAIAMAWTRLNGPHKALVWVCAGLVGLSRYYLNYHSPLQIAAGGILGLALGLIFSTGLPLSSRLLAAYEKHSTGKQV